MGRLFNTISLLMHVVNISVAYQLLLGDYLRTQKCIILWKNALNQALYYYTRNKFLAVTFNFDTSETF
jgi:hypothetical protein